MKYTLLTLLVLSNIFLVGCSTPSSIPTDTTANENTDSESDDAEDTDDDAEDN